MQNHLSKPEDLMLQNATPLRKSAPGPPNSSDEHVSPATENASLQILFKCRKCYKTLTFCSLLTRCTILCACHAKQRLNVQKCSVPLSFLHSWLGNLLRATTACTFSTSQLPKVVRSWCALYNLVILTSKRASRHNGVHFFDIFSKTGPNMVCFVHFDFEMCFAPQRRALFRQRNS